LGTDDADGSKASVNVGNLTTRNSSFQMIGSRHGYTEINRITIDGGDFQCITDDRPAIGSGSPIKELRSYGDWSSAEAIPTSRVAVGLALEAGRRGMGHHS
jgi:hypothetical protein